MYEKCVINKVALPCLDEFRVLDGRSQRDEERKGEHTGSGKCKDADDERPGEPGQRPGQRPGSQPAPTYEKPPPCQRGLDEK